MKKNSNHISREDWKFVPTDPDPDFNADHNRDVVERTIKKMDGMKKKKMKEWEAKTKERSSAIATYLKSLDGAGESDIKKYFGRKELARLRGEEALERIKDGLTVLGNEGNVVRTPNGKKKS